MLSVVLPSVCKLFAFSSSSQEPLGWFQPNVAQSIHECRKFMFVQRTLFQGEIITKWRKYIDEIEKSSPPQPLGHFHTYLAQSIFGWKELLLLNLTPETHYFHFMLLQCPEKKYCINKQLIQLSICDYMFHLNLPKNALKLYIAWKKSWNHVTFLYEGEEKQ